MQWTDAQKQAIEARGSNLLVSAAAGSGKTAVLAARIVALVREGTRMDDLLVVTFTKAAAAEMRSRILTALHDGADAGDMRLAEQAMRVERADISTLHGFCGKVCRDHFQAAGVDPTFRVADSAETAVLRAQAMEEALTACFEQPSDAFRFFSACLSQRELFEAVDALYNFLMARPDPWTWLDGAIDAYGMDAEALKGSPWMTTLLGGIRLDLESALETAAELIALAESAGLPETFAPFARKERDAIALYARAVAQGFDALMKHGPLSFDRQPSKKKDTDPEALERHKALRNEMKDKVKAAGKLAEWLAPLEMRAEDHRLSAVMAAGLRDAVSAFHERFLVLKAEKNVLDFHDLEHFTLKALREPSVADAYHEKYKHVFVDEYQDSSLLQEALLQSVTRGDNLFMVGDVKQSIYRFRLAEPTLFLRKMRSFSTEPGAGDRKIILNANYRSQIMLLSAVNDVFDRVFTGGPMEIVYDEEARLLPGTMEETPGVPAELHLIVSDMEPEPSDDEADALDLLPVEARSAIREEANRIADQILALRTAEGGGYELRDMAILMRTVRGRAAQVVETLRGRNIPAWSDLSEDALERREVQTIVALLRAIDNLRQDIPLLAALRGPALGLDEASIAAIRLVSPESAFSEAVFAYAKREDDLGKALAAFIDRLRGWAADAQVLPLGDFVHGLYMETGYYADVGALPDGDIRQANLRMLAEHAGSYQQAQAGGLSGFLRYLERVRSHEGIAAADIGERDNVVRVLSIHKSKGLQFPVVFVAGLGSRFGGAKGREGLQLHATDGLGMRAINPALRTTQETIAWKAIRERKRQESIAEEARILYVALTRAERRLILFGMARLRDVERWDAARTSAANAVSLLDWVAPCALHSANWQTAQYASGVLSEEQNTAVDVARIAECVRGELTPVPGRVTQALAWTAPEIDDHPLKQSVTAIVRTEAKRGEEERPIQSMSELAMRPLFLEERGLTATERGSAVHVFLHAVPFHADDLHAVARDLVAREILTNTQISALPFAKLEGLVRSCYWKRAGAASVVHREWGFNLRVESGQDRTLIQGVIDCCFLEEDGWVILDYKTDRVDDPAALIARYRRQLELYAEALLTITRLPVKEKALFLLDTATAYSL